MGSGWRQVVDWPVSPVAAGVMVRTRRQKTKAMGSAWTGEKTNVTLILTLLCVCVQVEVRNPF